VAVRVAFLRLVVGNAPGRTSCSRFRAWHRELQAGAVPTVGDRERRAKRRRTNTAVRATRLPELGRARDGERTSVRARDREMRAGGLG